MSLETRSSTNWSSFAVWILDPEEAEELELPVDDDDEPELGNEPVIMVDLESSEKKRCSLMLNHDGAFRRKKKLKLTSNSGNVANNNRHEKSDFLELPLHNVRSS